VSFSDQEPCRICGAPTREVGTKHGRMLRQAFTLRQCGACRFSFVADPCLDFARIYTPEYYRGQGADPLVDYLYEVEHPESTVRAYEWRGIARLVATLADVGPRTRWLDFGCGLGGLVSHLRASGCDAVGFEEGWAAGEAARRGVPIVAPDALDALVGTFDVVTAIEVIEHVPDPMRMLARIRSLMRRNGLLFLTTGNARPHRERLAAWGYVTPEIHVSFFEPGTLALALHRAGFVPQAPRWRAGFDDIVRFKVLKNIHVRRRSRVESALPWTVLSRLVDRRVPVSAHPVGWAR